MPRDFAPGQEVRRHPGRIEGQKGLRGLIQVAAQRQPDPAGEPLPDVWTPAGLPQEVRLLQADLSRSGPQRAHSRNHESELVIVMTDPIADMLTRIRNANQALLPEVELPHSKLKENVAQILKREGYLTDWAVEGKTKKTIKL